MEPLIIIGLGMAGGRTHSSNTPHTGIIEPTHTDFDVMEALDKIMHSRLTISSELMVYAFTARSTEHRLVYTPQYFANSPIAMKKLRKRPANFCSTHFQKRRSKNKRIVSSQRINRKNK